jgi:NAD(P)-dependent dehydrogenase (short-subunit alcohol dehydrogenase family)
LARELRGSGIDVILIEPGPIDTRIRANSIPHFERWIDWRASALRPLYEATLLQRLYQPKAKKDVFERPPSAVTRTLARALDARHPAPRYFVTVPTHGANVIRRLLPTWASDLILSKS